MSENKVGESKSPDLKSKSDGPVRPAKKRGKRVGDIGRALRSVYDETLREDVPDDFKNLLGKLS